MMEDRGVYPIEQEEPELSLTQIEKLDELDNYIFGLGCLLTEKEPEWDISWIGQIRDYAEDIMLEHGYAVHVPAIVSDANGENRHVEDWRYPEKPEEPTFGAQAVAKACSVDIHTVRRWIHAGVLKATMDRRTDGYRIKASDLSEFLRTHPKYLKIVSPSGWLKQQFE